MAPTGYTADVYEGKDQTFEEFVLRCARAMGACMLQRDEPFSALPKTQQPSTYYRDALRKTRQEFEMVKALPDAKAQRRADKERKQELERREQADLERVSILKRYQALLEKVHQWTPPTPDHVAFKQFMIEQLESSIRFDCTPIDREPLPEMSGEEWKAKKLKRLLKDIDYYDRKDFEEVTRTQERNAWIKKLYASLGLTGE